MNRKIQVDGIINDGQASFWKYGLWCNGHAKNKSVNKNVGETDGGFLISPKYNVLFFVRTVPLQ
jgi:hypothetical protein